MLLPSLLGPVQLPTSWLLGCEFLLPSLANIHAVSLVASSLPRPYPSPADGNKEGKTKEGSAQIILSKNAFLFLTDSVLNHLDLQLDDSVA